MKLEPGSILKRNIIFAWIAFISVCVLLVPLTAMQFTEAVNWGPVDFALMGLLVFGGGSFFVITLRKIERKYWTIVGVIFLATFIYIWAELAIGVFTGFGT